MRLLLSVFALCFCLLTSAFADNPIHIQAQPCFDGMSGPGVCPIVVTVQNRGPSVDGAVAVKIDSYSSPAHRYVYPLSLPTGTSKRLIVYPFLSQWGQPPTVTFEDSFRKLAESAPVVFAAGGQDTLDEVALIGDETGGLEALRNTKNNDAIGPDYHSGAASTIICYARPEDAPDRAVAYNGISTLVITDGAERMIPAQWSAIRHWVMGGRSLILLGGAGAQYLRVSDIQTLSPLHDLHEVSVHQLNIAGIVNIAGIDKGTSTSGETALVSGTLNPGATAVARQDGIITLATRQLGAGTVLFVAFNPLEKAFRTATNGAALWNTLIKTAGPVMKPSMFSIALEQNSTSYGYGHVSTYGSPSTPGSVGTVAGKDPFQLALPPSTAVASSFIIYFILVVPVTYLILKRMKRLELAWITSPIISIAFAFAFYFLTASLYQSGMSRRTFGVIVAAAGQKDAQFQGDTEIFFPRGGNYPIEVANAESLESSAETVGYPSFSGLSGRAPTLETVDEGTVTAPDYSVTNLAFRRLYFNAPIADFGAVDAQISQATDGTATGTLRNGTSEALHDCVIALPGNHSLLLGDLQPGQSVALGKNTRVNLIGTEFVQGELLRSVRNSASRPAAYLVANVTGAGLGPQFGKYVGGDRSVTAFISLPIRKGQAE